MLDFVYTFVNIIVNEQRIEKMAQYKIGDEFEKNGKWYKVCAGGCKDCDLVGASGRDCGMNVPEECAELIGWDETHLKEIHDRRPPPEKDDKQSLKLLEILQNSDYATPDFLRAEIYDHLVANGLKPMGPRPLLSERVK
jgi:hypothetical protein